jgi:hypothetical protein
VSNQTPIAYTIKCIGKPDVEIVFATSVQIDPGDAPKYVFRKAGEIVREIFVHALEIEPKPKFPQTAESRAAWEKFGHKAKAPLQAPHLKRD